MANEKRRGKESAKTKAGAREQPPAPSAIAADLFSTRNRKLPDVFVYHELPRELRAQMVHILEDVIGPAVTITSNPSHDGWRWIARTVAHEHGLPEIPHTRPGTQFGYDWFGDCLDYVMNAEPDRALDVVELGIRVADRVLRNDGLDRTRRMNADDAIADLNHRFRTNGCGYQYANGQIVRVDSQLIHAEVVQPALALLMTKGFEGPNQEFLSAHEHFRHGRVEEAVTDACKVFESTIKAICDARGWTYDAKATANPLIQVVIRHGLVPTYSQEQLENVAKCLIGVATIRNKNAGHGAGSKPRDVPDHYAAYALHLAAANIVFLVECHNAMPK